MKQGTGNRKAAADRSEERRWKFLGTKTEMEFLAYSCCSVPGYTAQSIACSN